jgi:hypothetical protein
VSSTTARIVSAIGRLLIEDVDRLPTSGEQSGMSGSGGLDGRDLELQGDLVANQDAAGLQRGVPGDAVVLAVDPTLPSKPTRWLPNG